MTHSIENTRSSTDVSHPEEEIEPLSTQDQKTQQLAQKLFLDSARYGEHTLRKKSLILRRKMQRPRPIWKKRCSSSH